MRPAHYRKLTSNAPPENIGWSSEVDGSPLGENVATLLQEVEVLQRVTVAVARHVDSFSSDDYHFVASEDELGHDAGEAAQLVAPSLMTLALGEKPGILEIITIVSAGIITREQTLNA